jgi:hypothetical protein
LLRLKPRDAALVFVCGGAIEMCSAGKSSSFVSVTVRNLFVCSCAMSFHDMTIDIQQKDRCLPDSFVTRRGGEGA